MPRSTIHDASMTYAAVGEASSAITAAISRASIGTVDEVGPDSPLGLAGPADRNAGPAR